VDKAARGRKVKSPQEDSRAKIEAACPASPWAPHLSSYPDKVVLRFLSQEHLEKAIDLLWTEELRSLPHSTAGRKTMVVPAEAVEYFSRAGLTFTTTKLRSITEPPPKTSGRAVPRGSHSSR
jgi:hypothetical protein